MTDSTQSRPVYFLILLAGVWYLFTLAPSILFFDSPEFVDTAWTLGISHPAGFPLYNMLAKAMTFLPAGSIAFRVNLFSALASVIALGLLSFAGVALLKILFLDRSPGLMVWSVLVPVGFLAFSKPYWLQSIQAEVYTLHVAFTAGILLLLFLWKLRDDFRFLYGAGLAFGLSAGNHATVAFYLPAILVLFFCWCRERRWIHLTRCICLFLLGLSVYAYLPLRSVAEPSFDFGNPETVEGFFYQVTDRRHANYHFRVFDSGAGEAVVPSLAEQASQAVTDFLLRAKYMTGLLTYDLTGNLSWICFAGLFVGAWHCYKRSRPLFFALLIVVAGNIAFFYDWGRESLLPTYVVAVLMTAIMLVYFLDAPWALAPRENGNEEEEDAAGLRWKPIAWALMVLLIPYTIVVNYNWADQSSIYSGETLLKRNYLKLDNHSLFLPGMSWFNYYYHQDVERLRDDVTAVPAWDLLSGNPPGMLTPKRYPDLKLPDPSRFSFDSYENIAAYNREILESHKNVRPILLEHNQIYFDKTPFAADFIPHKTIFVKYAPGISESEDDAGLLAWQDFSHILNEEVQRSLDEENQRQGVLGLKWGNIPKLLITGTALYAHDTGRFELEAEALEMNFKSFGLDTADLKLQWLENRLHLKKSQEALDTLEYLEKKYPDAYATQLARGKINHVAKRREKAIQYYVQATQIKPSALRPALELATLYAERGDAALTRKAMAYARARVTSLRELTQFNERAREIEQLQTREPSEK